MGQKFHRINGRHLLRLTQTGQTEGIRRAHDFQQPGHGKGPLVVELGFDGGNEVFLLAFHEGREKSPIFPGRIQ